MKNNNATKTLMMSGFKLTKDKDGTKLNPTQYKQIIGSLMYLIVSQPDLNYMWWQ